MAPNSIARKICYCMMILLVLSTLSRLTIAADDLRQNFITPPDEAKPRTWWHWNNGNISKEGITADLEAMKRVGIAEAQIFNVEQGAPRGPVRFMSPQWYALVQHAFAEADRLGMELTIHNCSGWSESGGPWVTVEQSMQKVVWSEQNVRGPQTFKAALPKPKALHDYYKDIAVFAFPKFPGDGHLDAVVRIDHIANKSGMASQAAPEFSHQQVGPDGIIAKDKLLDLTEHLAADGTLNWEVPAGDWTILRMGHTTTGKENAPAVPEGRGLECDKMSRTAVTAHFHAALDKLIAQAGPLGGKSFKYVLCDSWEAHCQNWTPLMRDEFKKRRGYDPLPWLPVLTGRVVGSLETSERFLWDFRRTIADLIAENHYGTMQQLCHENKLKFYAEAPGIGMPTTADELQCKGRTDYPMGEFWVGRTDGADVKEAASAAHIYGKLWAAAESFTATPDHAAWREDPYSLKALGYKNLCLGLNRIVFHRYSHQPYLDRAPGITMGPWGTNFERTQTWWEQGAAWMTYIARCQYLLSRGQFVADILYYYGENVPRDLQFGNLNPPPPSGHDYDVCNQEMLLQLTVQDGHLRLPDGMSYRVLVLPQTDRMTPEVLHKIVELVQGGATIIGPKPQRSPSLAGYPKCDDEVRKLADSLTIWNKPLALDVPADFETADKGLMSIHRRTDDADIYFVSNQRYSANTADCTFRVSGKLPELWHPDSGRMETASIWSMRDGRTTVHLNFDPAGSVFVIFRKPAGAMDSVVSITGDKKDVALKIVKAEYGIRGQKTVDVTALLAGRVQNGGLTVTANNNLAGDPVVDSVKRLYVDYILDGVAGTQSVTEGELLEIGNGWAGREMVCEDGKLIATQSGSFTATFASGKTRKIEVAALPSPIELAGPWSLNFPPKWGAPEHVALDKLISWTAHGDDGVRHFSGTATYTIDFQLSADQHDALYLDLGRVKNLAEVTVNGKNLGVLWKKPFRVEVTDAVHSGMNHLEVRVTNLWPNRLIGDLNLPAEKRFTWTTYNPYKVNSPLLESGLLGPVVLQPAQKVPLQ